jgi:hypothetical protein
MLPTICPYRDEDVFPFSLGEPVEEGLRAHLADCPVCRERLERFLSEATALRQAAEQLSATILQAPATPPRTLGKYYVVGTLCATPRAEFYRALHPELSREVVLRVERAPVPAKGERRAWFLHEARVLAELSHPNLARIRDANFQGDRAFLVLDVKSEPLAKTGPGLPWPAERAVVLTARLGRALEAAHQQGVAARSVTPLTVLVDEAGEPLLIDLGLAGGTDGACAAPTGVAVGRGETSPPRVAANIQGLGRLLYFLLVGQEPSAQLDPIPAGSRAHQQEALQRAAVPPQLQGVCVRALTAGSAEGYARVADIAADLERWLRPGRAWLGWAVGAAVLVVIAGVWWLSR